MDNFGVTEDFSAIPRTAMYSCILKNLRALNLSHFYRLKCHVCIIKNCE